MRFSLPSFALTRPVTIIMMIVTLLGLGAIAWHRIPVELLPKMDLPFIIVHIPYPGSTPGQVENEIAIPAEGEFRTISQLRRVNTDCSSDGATIRLSFSWDADMGIAAAEVRDRMERLKLSLPDTVDRIFLRRWSSDSLPIIVFGLSSTMPYEELSHLARTNIRSRLLRIEGVAEIQVFGKPEPEVLVEFDQQALRDRSTSIYQAISTLRNASLNMSVGELRDGGEKHFVRVIEEFRHPSEIEDLLIGPNALRVRDVADVSVRAREAESDFSVDGKDSVVILIQKESEANTVAVCDEVLAEVEAIRADPQYEGIEPFTIFSQGEVIRTSLETLMKAGRYGGLLAVVVLYLFLRRFRPTLLVALAIPASVVGALVFMYFVGMTLNLVTMASMIIALGMLVDNSIVVIENIYRYNQLGLDPRESARRGASEVGLAITAATMTTIVVFIPILYLESGQMASYMRQFGLPITVALLASLVIALTLIPLAASHMTELHVTHEHPWARRFAETFRRAAGPRVADACAPLARIHPIKGLIDLYAACLGWMVRWRLATFLLLLLVIGVTVQVPARNVSMQMTPEGDQRQVAIRLAFDQNFDLNMAADVVGRLRERIEPMRAELGIKNIFSDYSAAGGNITVFLKGKKDLAPGETYPYETKQVRDILWQKLPRRVPGAEVRFEIAQGMEGNKGIDIHMRGDDAETLREYAENFKDMLAAQVPKLDEVLTDQDRARDEIRLRVDEALANEASISPLMIAQTVDFALRGSRLPYMKRDGREIPVWAQFREDDRKTRANLDNVALLTDRNELVPLTRLVDFVRGATPMNIRRDNGKNVTTVSARTSAPDLSNVIADIRRVAAGFRMPRGYSLDMGDAIEDMEADLTNFITAMLLSVILIYLVMGALFESYVLPVSILASLPMAGIGVLWIMYLTSTPFESVTFIGIILLAGIIVNNGIVIIDHINQLRLGGLERGAAIVQAGRDRFRPVMMTALTTILGCVPLALGRFLGGEAAFEGLGRSLIGGLVSGTLLTLFIVPLVYTFIDDMREWFQGFLADAFSVARARS